MMLVVLLVVSAAAHSDPRTVLLRFRRGEGPIKVKEVSFRGLKCTDITARMKIEGFEWRFDAIRGKFYGGVLTGNLVVDRKKEGRPFKLRLSVGGAKLGLIAKEFAGRETKGRVSGEADGGPEPLFPLLLDYEMKGRLSAEVELAYKGVGTSNLAGRGSVMVTKAELAHFPAVMKVLSFLSFPKLTRDVMEVAELHFVLTPRGVVFQFAETRSGNGALALRARRNSCLRYDGGLDFVIEPHIQSRLLKRIPGLGDIVYEIVALFERSSMRVKVSGSLKEPEVSWAPLH